MIKIIIDDLIPISKLRHRMCFRNNKRSSYTPSKTKKYEEIVQWHAKKEMKGKKIFDSSVCLFVFFFFTPPESWSEAKKKKTISNKIFHTSKPDLDNLVKAIKDSLTNIVYIDDRLVSQLIVSKQYSDKNKVRIFVGDATNLDYDEIFKIMDN